MSIYVFMRLLESVPSRYDFAIDLMTLGRLNKAYDRLADHIRPGQRVLDVGCGTGALTLRAAARGASVTGIDINPQMLAEARRRAKEAGVDDCIVWREMGVAELEQEPAQRYDVVTSGLCFSELSADEFDYSMLHIRRLLKPGGLLLAADEVRPRAKVLSALFYLVRAVLVVITYILTQQTTHPISNLPEKVRAAGFCVKSLREMWLGSLVELVAVRR